MAPLRLKSHSLNSSETGKEATLLKNSYRLKISCPFGTVKTGYRFQEVVQ